MFKRNNDFFVVVTNNLEALEGVSEYIFLTLKMLYCIQIEVFSNMTLYQIIILMPEHLDCEVEQQINEYLELKHVKLFN